MSRCGSASALSVFVVYGVLPPFLAFWRRWDLLAHGGGAVKNNVNLQQGYNKVTTRCKLTFTYFVASSNGRIPELDSGDSSSNLLAIAVILRPIFKRIGETHGRFEGSLSRC